VLFDGIVDLTRLDETRIAELGIGRKFQKPTVFESQTVQDNLLLALNVDHSVRGTLFWRGSKAEAERIDKVLETIRPTMARSSEVLPTPLRPSTQVTLPGSAVSETPRSACAAP